MAAAPQCIWNVAATLGEGPLWDWRDGALWFVDIVGGNLHRYDPATAAGVSDHVGGNPGFVLPAAAGGHVIGNRDTLFHRSAAGMAPILTVAMPAHNRFNDATVDAAGRIWFGSMDDDQRQPTGRVYLLDRGVHSVAGGAAIITNGPAASADGRWLYHVDSSERTIWRFDISNGPSLRDGSVFATFTAEEGVPDGVILDADDHLWVGLWGGWCARRYAPDGRMVAQIALPCANVTKIALGGDDLCTAYVTTARLGIDAAALAEQPLAGGLFSFRVDVPGRPSPLAILG
jgi:xylono-1,5-lactonase